MKYLSLLIILFSINSFSEDYKSAARLKEGDVISADVFNDILDRIELSLVTPTSTDLLGTWDLVQTNAVTGCLGEGPFTCFPSGYGSVVDSTYKQRIDTVTFTDDGDGTFSLQTTNYCAFTLGAGDSSCNKNFAIVDRRLLISGGQNMAFIVDKISPTRILLSKYAGASNSYAIIRLDKKALAPNPPTALAATLSSGTVSLSWTASEGGATSYTVKAKTSVSGTYSDVVTNNSGTTYTDTLSSGTKWYRVFAVDSNGTSIGSNVVSVTR